jgi:hypothetical protein
MRLVRWGDLGLEVTLKPKFRLTVEMKAPAGRREVDVAGRLFHPSRDLDREVRG